jgi:hypothetical protein
MSKATAKATNVRLSCTCGAWQGMALGISPKAGNHVVCYCNDCQSFARFLGRAPEILDAQGGTEIFQMSPARIEVCAGAEKMACMRLSPRGLLRWYASCCNTPIGNTLPRNKLPFVGLIHLCLPGPPGQAARDATLGPVLARGFRQYAKGDAAAVPADRVPIALLVLRFAGLMMLWKLRGDARRSVFFAPASGQPVASPRVISAAERARLRAGGT